MLNWKRRFYHFQFHSIIFQVDKFTGDVHRMISLSTLFYQSCLKCLMNFKLLDPYTLTLTKSCKWWIILICFECWILPQFCLLEFLARSYIKSIYKCCTLDFNAIFYINYRKPHPTFIQLIWPQILTLCKSSHNVYHCKAYKMHFQVTILSHVTSSINSF